MNEIVLRGLDGSNPLGYLAALGALRIADERGLSPSLRWELQDVWRPILRIDETEDGLLEALFSDVEEWRRGAPELELRYEKNNRSLYELKPPPAAFQEFAHQAANVAMSGSRRWADQTAGYAAAHAQLGTDRGGATKPTAFHFSAGQQLFLGAVRDLCEKITRDDLAEALLGPWRYESTLPVLGWDVVAGERDYALRASDPSKDKKTGVPGADWLGFRALGFFPVVLRGGRAVTTGFSGRGKRYTFHWGLWTVPLEANIVGTVVARRWSDVPAREREARGIALALCSRVRRTDQGGYGSFGAAAIDQGKVDIRSRR